MTVMTETENAAALMRLDVKGEFAAMQQQIEEMREELDGIRASPLQQQIKDLQADLAEVQQRQGFGLHIGEEIWDAPTRYAVGFKEKNNLAHRRDATIAAPPYRVEALGRDWVVARDSYGNMLFYTGEPGSM